MPPNEARHIKSHYVFIFSGDFHGFSSEVTELGLSFVSCFHQYEEFRAKKREKSYSDEDLEESYGFLLFDNFNEVKISKFRLTCEMKL